MNMSSISFFNEDIDFKLSNQRKTRDWITKVVKREGYTLIHINYIFCSEEYLHGINIDHLSHDTYTDIITFDQSDNAQDIEADIYISVDRVRENAKSFKFTFDHELRRVMIHGVLHLMVYSDKTPEETEVMRKREDSSLSLYFV